MVAECTRLLACKIADLVFIPSSQRVFEITPLVPGSPSLDVRSHSPGETRRQKRGAMEYWSDGVLAFVS
jgi:hypothetical protein